MGFNSVFKGLTDLVNVRYWNTYCNKNSDTIPHTLNIKQHTAHSSFLNSYVWISSSGRLLKCKALVGKLVILQDVTPVMWENSTCKDKNSSVSQTFLTRTKNWWQYILDHLTASFESNETHTFRSIESASSRGNDFSAFFFSRAICYTPCSLPVSLVWMWKTARSFREAL